jgi:hypothetical protein
MRPLLTNNPYLADTEIREEPHHESPMNGQRELAPVPPQSFMRLIMRIRM